MARFQQLLASNFTRRKVSQERAYARTTPTIFLSSIPTQVSAREHFNSTRTPSTSSYAGRSLIGALDVEDIMVLTNMDPIILGMTRISNRLSAQREMSPACERMPIGNARHTERGPKREEATMEAKVMPSVKLHPTLPVPLRLIPC